MRHGVDNSYLNTLIAAIAVVSFYVFFITNTSTPSPGWRPMPDPLQNPLVTMNSVGGLRIIKDEDLTNEHLYFTIINQSEAQAWAAGGIIFLSIVCTYWQMLPQDAAG